MQNKVAALVLTYNRLEYLREIINALRNQTRKIDEIIVVNNSSTDGTAEWLTEQKDLTIIHQENVGSSGGQYTGIKTAYEKGYDWIWTMDDDVVPQPECLEMLLRKPDTNLVRAPLRYEPDGKPFFNDAINYNLTYPFKSIWINLLSEKDLANEYIPAVGITFEGPIFHRSLIEKIGFPERNFFIYGDDTEYFIRAWKVGFNTEIVRDARLDRKIQYIDPNFKFTWKQYYIIRNIIAIDVLHGNLPVRLIRPFGYFLKWLSHCRSVKDVGTTFKALFNGYFYKSSK